MKNDIPAEARSSNINGSLNCLRKRSQRGSGSSWGNSLGPSRRSRVCASAGESPWIREVSRRSATSCGLNLEYIDVVDEERAAGCRAGEGDRRTGSETL